MSVKLLIGRKLGMTRIFDDRGADFPVTIIEAGPCSIVQLKTMEDDEYSAVQIGFQDKVNSANKAEKGRYSGSEIKVKKHLKEFKLNNLEEINLDQDITVDIFSIGDKVTVSGTSKGKGFAGHMKRHNFSGGRRSHGKNSVMRKSGAVGAGSDPSRIWAGTRMAGRMGDEKVTVKNLEIVRVEKDNNLLFIKGAVPGPKKNIVYITKQ